MEWLASLRFISITLSPAGLLSIEPAQEISHHEEKDKDS